MTLMFDGTDTEGIGEPSDSPQGRAYAEALKKRLASQCDCFAVGPYNCLEHGRENVAKRAAEEADARDAARKAVIDEARAKAPKGLAIGFDWHDWRLFCGEDWYDGPFYHLQIGPFWACYWPD